MLGHGRVVSVRHWPTRSGRTPNRPSSSRGCTRTSPTCASAWLPRVRQACGRAASNGSDPVTRSATRRRRRRLTLRITGHGAVHVNGFDPGTAVTETLTRALSLWRGAAPAEYADETWSQPAAHRWTELHAITRERLYGAGLDRGESAVLVPELRSFVAEAPLREERWRPLALWRSHRRADAHAALRRLRTLLADELGVDPGPAFAVLKAEIPSQAGSLDTITQTAEKPLDSIAAPQLPLAPTDNGSDIVERDDDLAIIDEALRSALDGDGQWCSSKAPPVSARPGCCASRSSLSCCSPVRRVTTSTTGRPSSRGRARSRGTAASRRRTTARRRPRRSAPHARTAPRSAQHNLPCSTPNVVSPAGLAASVCEARTSVLVVTPQPMSGTGIGELVRGRLGDDP